MNALLIPQQPQTQAALTDQLKELKVAANRLGLYDAADLLQNQLDNPPTQLHNLVKNLGKTFGEKSKELRSLEDQCVHKVDQDRARLRSCLFQDLADCLRKAIQ